MAGEKILAALVKERGVLRGKITRLFNKVGESQASLSDIDCSTYLMKAKGFLTEINDLDKKVLTQQIALDEDEQTLEADSEQVEKYADDLMHIISILESVQKSLSVSLPQNQPNINHRHVGSSSMKLPPIELPKFSNEKGENMGKFFQIFDAIIDKRPDLSEHQHFLLLRGQLTGAPRILVDTLDFKHHTYAKAKENLLVAFDSAEKSKTDLIELLTLLRMDDAEEPYRFIGQVRSIISGVEAFDVKVEDFLRHFIWQGFNHEFRNHLTNITNKFVPSLSDIEENMFDAANRYNNTLAQNAKSESKHARWSKPKDVSANAVNIDKKKGFYCALCRHDKKPDDHRMSECKVYATGKSRCDKIKQANGCLKCSYFSHTTKDCKFVLRNKCKNCNLDHFTFLCWKTNNEKYDKQKNNGSSINNIEANEETTTQGASCSATYQTISKSPYILPTFTGEVRIGGGDYVPIRIFKDGGSQNTFISTSVAEYLNLPVKRDNLPLEIRGFNSNKRVNTKTVSLDLRFGAAIFKHEAICIDEIRTSFSTKGMGEVARSFESKGYQIADPGYLVESEGEVCNIDMVLGTDGDHMLELKYHTFGQPGDPDTRSSYIDSTLGVIFSGSVAKMKQNIKYLPSKIEEVSCNFLSVAYPHLLPEGKPNSILGKDIDNGEVSFKEINAFACTDAKDHADFCYSADIDINKNQLDDSLLEKSCSKILNICPETDHEEDTETNLQLIDYVLTNSIYDSENRLTMPLLWNNKCSHLLSKNYHLAKKLLKSNFDKLANDPAKLAMYDSVFRQQEELGIIERIDNVDGFLLEHPEASFLCHMGVFRMAHESTKCRVVFLSNMCEKFGGGLSHNSAMLPGPNLNAKISTAVLLNRFDKYMLTFDIQKAFLAIKLFDIDSYRLCFLWYRNIESGDHTIIGFRNLRLSFGLRNSPTILMLGLYKMLMLDSSGDENIDNMKRKVYNTIYMDNGNLSSMSENELIESYPKLKGVFEKHQMLLQQFYTNSPKLQASIDNETETETPSEVKYFGMNWNRVSDTLAPKPINLDPKADTKRKILAAINGIYDIYGIYMAILLRARLFLQKVLTDPELAWDTKLSSDKLGEWQSICRQVNGTPPISIPRCVGARDEPYQLVATSDASKDVYAVVVYIKNTVTNQVSYLTARSRLVNITGPRRTIPAMEFQGLAYAVEILYEIFQELTGSNVVIPINITSCHIFVDSQICLHWLVKYSIYFEKLQSLSVFVKNRLRFVTDICSKMPVTFRHIAGEQNSSDFLTRPITPKALLKSNFFAGPDVLKLDLDVLQGDLAVTLPNPICSTESEVPETVGCAQTATEALTSAPGGLIASQSDHLVPLEKYSFYGRLVAVVANVYLFTDKLKVLVARRKGDQGIEDASFKNCFERAVSNIISTEQKIAYREVFDYFDSPSKHLKDIPGLVTKFNLYRDHNNVIRVKSKFPKQPLSNPIILPKSNLLTTLVIRHVHETLGHAGTFAVIRELRKSFWIECILSAVKRCLNSCIVCKRINAKPIKLNQNTYRNFRIDPPKKCFRSIFIDHIGPIMISLQGKKTKVWLLIVTCLFSRAVNLEICMDLTVKEFLQALQVHCNRWGMFSELLSDLGSSFTAGVNSMKAFLSDFETQKYFGVNGIREIRFQHYPKGNSSLGSVVETLVKQVKFLIQKAIRGNILDFFQFQFLVTKAISLINKRPVAFKEQLSTMSLEEVPTCITPEMLLRGSDCPTVNLIAQLQPVEDQYTPQKSVESHYEKLCSVRERLVDVYHKDFLANLVSQAVDKPDRYKPSPHRVLTVGDIVLLTDKHLKQYQYPMGRVLKVEENGLGEVTAAVVLKGDTREKVYRHVTSLIFLLPADDLSKHPPDKSENVNERSDNSNNCMRKPSERKAAQKAKEQLRNILGDD